MGWQRGPRLPVLSSALCRGRAAPVLGFLGECGGGGGSGQARALSRSLGAPPGPLHPNGAWGGAQQGPPCPQVPSTPGCAGTPAVTVPTGISLAPTDAHGAWTGSAGGRTDGQTDTGDSRNVPKGLGQDEAPRHGTGGAGVTRLQRKGPIRGGFSLVPPPSPSPSPSSCQAGGEIWRRIWGTPCSWHRYSELPGAAPDSCPRQAAGG